VLVGRVVIGMDPHERSATIEVLDDDEQPLMGGRFGTDSEGYRLLLAAGRQFPQRLWAVEGCQGVGRHLAQRLVGDGETVVDVPAKLSARAWVFSTGQGRKTDATDAHSVAVVALRTRSLRQVRPDDRTVALRLLADRRDELGAARTLTINRLHRLLIELVPGGAKKALTARQARALLTDVPAGDVVRETRRQLAAELVDELEVIDTRIKTAKKQLTALVAETGSRLMRLNGIGPAARRYRRRLPVPDPRPLRLLERHGPARCLLRRPDPPPALPSRQPPDQPDPAHHGGRATAPPGHRRPALLRPPGRRGQDPDGGHAGTQTATVRRRLPATRQRPETADRP
jgi:transposase